MAASNKKRKKLARELQAETGLRYTDALERVRLQTTKEERMQVAQNSPLLRAIQKQKSKWALEAPEADALRPKVEEAVRAVLAVLGELPVRDGMRSLGGYGDEEPYGGLRQVGQLEEVQIVLGRSPRMGKVGDDRMQLWLSGPMSMPMQHVPKTVAVSVGGEIEDPSSWVPFLDDLGLNNLRTALQVCAWLTGPETAGSQLAAQEVFVDDDQILPESEFLAQSKVRRLGRIEAKRRSLLSQIEEPVPLGFAQVQPSSEAVLEGKPGNGGSWSGELVLESDAPELLLVTEVEVGGEILKVGLFASCFRRGAEPVVRFQEREVPEGGRVVVRLKNLDDAVPHAVTGLVRTLPSSFAFGMAPAESQVAAAVLFGDDLDLG